MGRRRDWLDRFRPAGAPGSPALPGVPSDARPAETELRPVFALLETTSQECARLRTEAERQAAHGREDASREAGRIVAEARRDAPAVRAEAQARFMTSAQAQMAAASPEKAA